VCVCVCVYVCVYVGVGGCAQCINPPVVLAFFFVCLTSENGTNRLP